MIFRSTELKDAMTVSHKLFHFKILVFAKHIKYLENTATHT